MGKPVVSGLYRNHRARWLTIDGDDIYGVDVGFSRRGDISIGINFDYGEREGAERDISPAQARVMAKFLLWCADRAEAINKH